MTTEESGNGQTEDECGGGTKDKQSETEEKSSPSGVLAGNGQTEDECGGGTKDKQSETEEKSSPRGVLERVASDSARDNGSSNSDGRSIDDSGGNNGSSNSDGSSIDDSAGNDKVPVEKVNPWDIAYGGLQLKKLIGQIKKMPSTRFATNPLAELSIKSLKKRLGRNNCPEEPISCDDSMAPKPSWRYFKLEELNKATHHFTCDNLIGKGGQAEVYKGLLPDGQIVAVKKIIKEEKPEDDRVGGFLAELGIIAHIDHHYSAKLIGFSADGGLHLVLKYCPHGSLASALHGCEAIMDWNMRYKVALGVAEGLKYLHYDCQKRIVHRDITASNILLSEDYEPQISDFGLAKWLPEKWSQHIVSPIEGTFGYMAPEYFMHGIVNEKIDVFAYGVLLLELITGRRSVDSCSQSLMIWAKPHLEQNNIKEIADPRLGEDFDVTEMKRAMFAASICIHHSPSMRPNMNRVVQVLKGERDLMADTKQKSMGMRSLLWDNCDVEDYTSATYLHDLNRHKELIME